MLNFLKKKIAFLIGRKLPYFFGKDRIIRFLYSPNKFKDHNLGEKFLIDYFGLKYEGITSNYIDWGVYFKEGLEKGLINYLKSEVNKFEYFFDIGSNSGSISLPFSKNPNLKIICFEPLKINYKKLTNNFKINNVYKNNFFYNFALSDINSEKDIYYNTENNNLGGATLENDRDKKNNKSEKIYTKKLDDLFDLKDKKIIIKIDVEGHEEKVINGAKNFLKNNKILMYLETTNKNLLQELIKLNYKPYYIMFEEGNYYFSNLQKEKEHDIILKNFD